MNWILDTYMRAIYFTHAYVIICICFVSLPEQCDFINAGITHIQAHNFNKYIGDSVLHVVNIHTIPTHQTKDIFFGVYQNDTQFRLLSKMGNTVKCIQSDLVHEKVILFLFTRYTFQFNDLLSWLIFDW